MAHIQLISVSLRTRLRVSARGLLAGMAMVVTAGDALAGELPFALAQASYRGGSEERQFDAVVEAVNKSTVAAETSGRVVDILYDVDDYVPKGAVILRFKGTEQRAEAGAAEAAVREAQARLEEVNADYNRQKELFDRKLVAQAALDSANAARLSARERLDAARHRLEKAQEVIGYTEVRAPFSGIVTKRHIELGEIATPGQPLMSGFSLDQLRVVASIPQTALEAVRQHKQVRILVPGQTTRVLTPTKVTFFPYADTASHTFKVRLELPKGSNGVLPGMMVKAAFVVGKDQHMTLPTTAIAIRSEVAAVYVVDRNKRVTLRQVRLGKRYDGGQLEILSGLDAGENVALDAVKAAIYFKQQQTGKQP